MSVTLDAQLEYDRVCTKLVSTLYKLKLEANKREYCSIDHALSKKIRDLLGKVREVPHLFVGGQGWQPDLFEKLGKFYKEKTEALEIFERTFNVHATPMEICRYSEKLADMDRATVRERSKILEQDWLRHIQQQLTHRYR